MNRFGFIDSSGIIKRDRFFGAGLLIIKNVGDMADKLAKNAQPAYNLVRTNKDNAIEAMIGAGRKDEVIKMLRNNRRFEMKFDNVRQPTHIFYRRMIDIFLSDSDNRFSAMVIDKENPTFKGELIQDTWETYTGYSASLVVREMQNLSEDKMCLVVDEITKPHNKPLSLEDTLLSKIRAEAGKNPSITSENIFGALSIESHSNMLMQLCDVLLGAVMYDFKKKNGFTSVKVENKKEDLVKQLRELLEVNTLAKDVTKERPIYFSVFESV